MNSSLLQCYFAVIKIHMFYEIMLLPLSELPNVVKFNWLATCLLWLPDSWMFVSQLMDQWWIVAS